MANKIMIIGTGNVGASIGYCFLNQRTAVNHLTLMDLNQADAEGEVLDLEDALAVAPSHLKLTPGTLADAKDSDIIIIAAGAPQNPGETRLELLTKNATIIKQLIPQIVQTGFQGIFLIVSNPVDLLTYLTFKYSGFPAHKVIGSGTILDSARLRSGLAKRLQLHPKSIHAYQIGEHGDSEFALWSSAHIAGQPLSALFTTTELNHIEDQARQKAYDIIAKKGSTYYGIGACVVHLVNSILSDEHRILPVSSYDEYNDIFYGFPTVINRSGASYRVNTPLSETEGIKLQRSINILRQNLQTIL